MRLRWGMLALALTLGLAHEARAAERVDLAHISVGNDDARAPGPSGSVRLTLDPKLQRAAKALLATARAPQAALVASDVPLAVVRGVALAALFWAGLLGRRTRWRGRLLSVGRRTLLRQIAEDIRPPGKLTPRPV